jgi:hypothetical protein
LEAVIFTPHKCIPQLPFHFQKEHDTPAVHEDCLFADQHPEHLQVSELGEMSHQDGST